ncbi:hypothetical protein ANTPLA_LOCUS7838 [Anthophora plagiata]
MPEIESRGKLLQVAWTTSIVLVREEATYVCQPRKVIPIQAVLLRPWGVLKLEILRLGKPSKAGFLIVLQHVSSYLLSSSVQVFRERGWNTRGVPNNARNRRRVPFGQLRSSKPISQCSPQKVRPVMPYNIYSSFHYSGLASPPAAR